jgi:redox-sensing transcriptional repressor
LDPSIRGLKPSHARQSQKTGDAATSEKETEDPARMPMAVVRRLSLYSRALTDLEMNSVDKVSSQELAAMLGLNSAQVRKDLAYFGQFGVPGMGYYVADLRQRIQKILRSDRAVKVILLGVGNLGSALISYGGFLKQGYQIQMAFDADRRKVGTIRGGIEIRHIDELEEQAKRLKPDVAILAVPADASQAIAERVVAAGITGILNFAPRRLQLPEEIKVHHVDLAIEMESLCYYLR